MFGNNVKKPIMFVFPVTHVLLWVFLCTPLFSSDCIVVFSIVFLIIPMVEITGNVSVTF